MPASIYSCDIATIKIAGSSGTGKASIKMGMVEKSFPPSWMTFVADMAVHGLATHRVAKLTVRRLNA